LSRDITDRKEAAERYVPTFDSAPWAHGTRRLTMKDIERDSEAV